MTTLEELIEQQVAAGVEKALAPYLRRLVDPECLTYTIPQAAKVIGTSPQTVRRAVDAGHLPLVPHMQGRRLIPRRAVEDLIAAGDAPATQRLEEAS